MVKYPNAVKQLADLLETNLNGVTEEELANKIYPIIKGNELEPKAFFQEIYSILIAKTNGPKLASFLIALEPKRAAELIRKTLG